MNILECYSQLLKTILVHWVDSNGLNLSIKISYEKKRFYLHETTSTTTFIRITIYIDGVAYKG